MRIRDILRKKGSTVVTVNEDRTIHDAICVLNENQIGALVVTGSDGGITGIISERDVLRLCGERCPALPNPTIPGEDPCPALVKDAMTSDVIIGVPEDALTYVMATMTKNRIRHLPVLDEGKLVGIISIGDVVNAHVEETEFDNRQLKDYIAGLTY